jgi:uncharacterized protein (DUF4213/DUF364 family)
MKILDDVLSTLNFDAPVRDIRQGVFHTAVLTRECGLAATLPRDALGQESRLVRDPGFLLDRSAEDLARMAYSESILEAAIGMAAMTAIIGRRSHSTFMAVFRQGEAKTTALSKGTFHRERSPVGVHDGFGDG